MICEYISCAQVHTSRCKCPIDDYIRRTLTLLIPFKTVKKKKTLTVKKNFADQTNKNRENLTRMGPCSPTPVSPTPVSPTPVSPTPVSPTFDQKVAFHLL